MTERRGPETKSDRDRRLADALRANLRRRKAGRADTGRPAHTAEPAPVAEGGRKET